MKRTLTILSFLLPLCVTALAQVQVQNLLTENLTNPIGIDVAVPRFSWQLVSPKRNVMQSAYEIRISADAIFLAKGQNLVWNTGKVTSDKSVFIPYSGSPLQSGKRYFWQVRVWDNAGKASSWSSPAFWQMGFLKKEDWKAKWIQPGFEEDTVMRPSPIFRKEFSTTKKVQSATAYITSHGVYEAHINGQRVGNAYLTPGWTSYLNRLQYQVFDVTNLLKTGSNAIGVTVSSGWYRGYIGFASQKNFYGSDISLLAQIEIVYSDGSSETIITDETWKSSTGSVRYSEIYHGETVDAREEKTGWRLAGYNDASWSGVKLASFGYDNLLSTYNELTRKKEVFQPRQIIVTPKGEKVIDFGQNLVGWVVMKVNGNAGDRIRLTHAEVLDKEGNFYTTNLRAARAEDIFILKGGAEETFEPGFTFHGFRYVRIEDYPGELKPENFSAVALYSDMKETGTFTSSHPLINQLQHNIQWGQKGNFLDVPTDCPQRDERLGWTGDAQAFARTATFNMGVHNFFIKWLKDVAADQGPNGSIPFVVPNTLRNAAGSAGWADAGTIIPWTIYLAYGDKRVLEEQYPSMKAWVEYMRQNSKNDLWNVGFHFGDWLFYRPGDDNDGRSAVTDKYLIAQCFYAHSTQLLINTAKLLGKAEEVTVYSDLLQKIKGAFMKEYVTPNGRLVSSTQTAYVLALNFDMLPESMRSQAAERLVQNIKDYNYHLTTGFLGTPYLCHVLSRFGHMDIAFRLLMQETYPSWLYPVKMGATTIWERWDGIKPDSTFQTPSMNSFNHYAYGAIGDWMYRTVAGIDTDEEGPGYKRIRIKPHTGGGLTHADAELITYYGPIRSGWKLTEGKFSCDVVIPHNTTARVHIPASSAEAISEGGKPLTSLKEIKVAGQEDGYVVLEVGSGSYRFSVTQ